VCQTQRVQPLGGKLSQGSALKVSNVWHSVVVCSVCGGRRVRWGSVQVVTGQPCLGRAVGKWAVRGGSGEGAAPVPVQVFLCSGERHCRRQGVPHRVGVVVGCRCSWGVHGGRSQQGWRRAGVQFFCVVLGRVSWHCPQVCVGAGRYGVCEMRN